MLDKFIKFIRPAGLFVGLFLYVGRLGATPISVEPGVYVSGSMKVTIRESGVSNILEIRADGADKKMDFLCFFLNTFSLRAAKSPYGASAIALGEAARGQELSVTDSVEGAQRTLRVEGGGSTKPFELNVTMVFDSVSGSLLSMAGLFKVAKYGWPNGWHSGPIKKTFANFACSDFLKSERQP
jgi:hypothetical protein